MATKGKMRTAGYALVFFLSSALISAYLWILYAKVDIHGVVHTAWDASANAFRLGRNTHLVPAGAVTTGPNTMNPRYDPTEPPRERFFDWTVERADLAPDGVTRLMYTINGQFPGPIMQVTEGDTVVVKVRNHIFDNYTVPPAPMSSKLYDVHAKDTDRKFTIHWHGLSMRGMQVMDGASAFTSCALTPGDEYTYRFVVQPEDVGTHWYHSHVGTSRADGLWGMLIVHAREDERKVLKERAPTFDTHWEEEIPIALGDHFHKMSPESLAKYVSIVLGEAEPVPESGLINGRHIFSCDMARYTGVPCPAGDKDEVGEYTEFHLRHDKQYRLRLVNVGSIADITFSVDGHTMTVIEADGTLVEPMHVHRIPISPGQRYSVILHREPSMKDSRVWMRAELQGECFKYMNPVLDPFIKAIVVYDNASPKDDWLAPLRVRQNYAKRFGPFRAFSKSERPTTHPWSPDIQDQGIPTEPCHDLEPGTLVPLIADPAPEFHPERGDRREARVNGLEPGAVARSRRQRQVAVEAGTGVGSGLVGVAGRDERGAAVAGPGEVDHLLARVADEARGVRVDEGQAGAGAPVAEEAGLDVVREELAAQERVVLEVDLADGQVVVGAPPGVHGGGVVETQLARLGARRLREGGLGLLLLPRSDVLRRSAHGQLVDRLREPVAQGRDVVLQR